MADERLIVALDVHTMDDVKKLVGELGDAVNFYKVGMERSGLRRRIRKFFWT